MFFLIIFTVEDVKAFKEYEEQQEKETKRLAEEMLREREQAQRLETNLIIQLVIA